MARLTAARFWSGLLTGALTGKRRRRWKAAANGNRFPRGGRAEAADDSTAAAHQAGAALAEVAAALVQWIPLLALTPASP